MIDPAEMSLDELNRRLAEIDAALDEHARAPSPEQYALLRERDRLRERAAEFWAARDQNRSVEELESELRALTRYRKSEIETRTGYVTSKGGSNQGPASGAWVKLAAQSWAASDVARLNVRIGEIESELERRRRSEAP